MPSTFSQAFPPAPTFTEKNVGNLKGKVGIFSGSQAGTSLTSPRRSSSSPVQRREWDTSSLSYSMDKAAKSTSPPAQLKKSAALSRASRPMHLPAKANWSP